MQTTLYTQEIQKENKDAIRQAAEVIRSGGIVVFPTETVYGLGANALDEYAVKKIFIAKGRPTDNPLIVHISDRAMLDSLVSRVTPSAEKLLNAFWPGPLTIVFPKKEHVPLITTGGLETIAVRMPDHQIAQDLIRLATCPIAAPSANISGKPSGTTFEHVYEDFVGKVDVIIDGGETLHGLESTVVLCTEDEVIILRPGSITKDMLQQVLGDISVRNTQSRKELDQSPGTRYRHYAPQAKIEIIQNMTPEKIASRMTEMTQDGILVGVLATDDIVSQVSCPHTYSLGPKDDLPLIAQHLYDGLRYFDKTPVQVIFVPSFSGSLFAEVIMDRLSKAAGSTESH